MKGFGYLRRLLKTLSVRRKPTTAQAVVIMFHRVAEPRIDPFGLSVTPMAFERAIQSLRSETTVLSPHEFDRMIHGLCSPGFYSLISFDDGYEDVVTAGLPIMQKYGVGGVLFIPSRILSDPEPFWWDILAEIILVSPQLPPRLCFDLQQCHHEWEVPVASQSLSEAEASSLLTWRCGGSNNPGPRARLFEEIWRVLFQTPDPRQRKTAMDSLSNQTGTNPLALQTIRLASLNQLQTFAAENNCAIGSHTINHVKLSALPDTEQREEIAGSKIDITKALGLPTAYFSYPHGGASDFTQATTAMVQETGYHLGFCSAWGRVDGGTTNPYAIPRLYIHNGSVRGLRSTLTEELFAS